MSKLYRFTPGTNVIEREYRDGRTYCSNAVYPEAHLHGHFTDEQIEDLFECVGNLPSDAIILTFPEGVPQPAKDELREMDGFNPSDVKKVLTKLQAWYRST